MSISPVPHRSRTTLAPDGATIGYLTVGVQSRPGLVVVHGAMQSAARQLDLAELLAPEFAVHLVDRRGRGASSLYPATATTATTATDVADVQAVVAATGARAVLGVSSGGVIAARVAVDAATSRSGPPVDTLILFEPALVVDNSIPLTFADRVTRELAAGDLPGALVTGMLGTQMGPAFLRFLPRALLRAMTSKMLSSDDARHLDDGEVHLRDLAACLPFDLAIVAENADHTADFAPISAATLLLNGDRTRPYLRRACDAIAGVIPGVRRVVLPGVGHSATGNRDQRGAPEQVADAVIAFLHASAGEAHSSR